MAAREFARGERIVITKGLSKGRHGTVLGRWHDIVTKGDLVIRNVRVSIDGEMGERIIRTDFLERCVEMAS